MDNIEENKTYINFILKNNDIVVESSCGDKLVFISLLKQMTPMLYEAVISSIKDPVDKLIIAETIAKEELVVKPSEVFKLGEKI